MDTQGRAVEFDQRVRMSDYIYIHSAALMPETHHCFKAGSISK